MPSLIIQLHAHPDELLEFCYTSAHKYNLKACVLAGHPSTPEIIDSFEKLQSLYRDFVESGSKFEFIFSILQNPLDSKNTTNNNFLDKHPDTIRIRIGKLRDNILEESSLGFKSDNEIAFKIAKKIATDLKKITKAGATASNNNGSAYIRTHRYTEKAKQLSVEGYKMRALGNSIYDFTAQ